MGYLTVATDDSRVGYPEPSTKGVKKMAKIQGLL
jgi:hypothetical protein